MLVILIGELVLDTDCSNSDNVQWVCCEWNVLPLILCQQVLQRQQWSNRTVLSACVMWDHYVDDDMSMLRVGKRWCPRGRQHTCNITAYIWCVLLLSCGVCGAALAVNWPTKNCDSTCLTSAYCLTQRRRFGTIKGFVGTVDGEGKRKKERGRTEK